MSASSLYSIPMVSIYLSSFLCVARLCSFLLISSLLQLLHASLFPLFCLLSLLTLWLLFFLACSVCCHCLLQFATDACTLSTAILQLMCSMCCSSTAVHYGFAQLLTSDVFSLLSLPAAILQLMPCTCYVCYCFAQSLISYLLLLPAAILQLMPYLLCFYCCLLLCCLPVMCLPCHCPLPFATDAPHLLCFAVDLCCSAPFCSTVD